jgi:hypothetical protein
MSTAMHVQLVSCIIMENRHVTIDEPQLTTSLCHANICAIIHKHLMMMKVHAPWVPRELMPKKRREGCRIAMSCSLFTKIKRDCLRDCLLVMNPGFTLSSGGEKAVRAVETL